eukprot:scaffold191584_cov24-Tisochrysis_lutea.AAC.1
MAPLCGSQQPHLLGEGLVDVAAVWQPTAPLMLGGREPYMAPLKSVTACKTPLVPGNKLPAGIHTASGQRYSKNSSSPASASPACVRLPMW